MRRFLPVAAMVWTAACTTLSSRETTSSWAVLAKADSVACSRWPLRDRDLQIDEVTYMGGSKPGFLVAGLKRDASPLDYFMPFSGDEDVDSDKLTELSLGARAILLGGAGLGVQPVAVALHPGSKSSFDLRSVPGNIVKYKGDLGGLQVVDGQVVQTKGGLWLSLKTEDNIYHLVHIDQGQGGKTTSQVLATPTFNDPPKLIANPNSAALTVLWKEGDTGKPLRLQQIQADGRADPAVTLDLAVASQLESLSALWHKGALYIAMIDGDTMIGQAELKIANVQLSSGSAVVKWSKSTAFNDAHAQEPVLVASKRGLEILVLNWIDEESTIARYLVAGGNLGKPTYSGVFAKGARILEAFAGAEQKDAFVLARSRGEQRWNFQLCKI